MSHFAVYVIGENPEEQLDPYWELDLDEYEMKRDPRAVFEIFINKEDIPEKAKGILAQARDTLADKERIIYSLTKGEIPDELKNHWNFKNKTAEEILPKVIKDRDRWAEKVKKYAQYCADENPAIITDWEGGCFDDEGNHGYWGNPNAKWDWYSIGGRWSGSLRLKKGKSGNVGERSGFNEKTKVPENRCDQAKKGDIDWDGMIAEQRHRAEKNWVKYLEQQEKDIQKQGREALEGKEMFGEHFWQMPYFLDKEEFIMRQINIAPFAFLKDGEWVERGSMGWWGMSSNNVGCDVWEKKFIEMIYDLPNDTLITVVDCHI